MKLQPIITNVQAGVLSGALEVLLVVSFAGLIFSCPLAAHLTTGLVLLLISATILGLVGTQGSSYPGMLVSLRTPVIPVLAAMVAATAATMTAQGREAEGGRCREHGVRCGRRLSRCSEPDEYSALPEFRTS